MMAEAILRSDSLIVGYGGNPVISGIDLGAELRRITSGNEENLMLVNFSANCTINP